MAENEPIEIDFPSLGSKPDSDPEPVAPEATDDEDDFSWLAMAFADEAEPDVAEVPSEPDDGDLEDASEEDIEAIASALGEGTEDLAAGAPSNDIDETFPPLPPAIEPAIESLPDVPMAEVPMPDVLMPDVPVPDVPVPDVSVPDLPGVGVPMPDVLAPDMPEGFGEVAGTPNLLPDLEILSGDDLIDEADAAESPSHSSVDTTADDHGDEPLDLDDVVAQLGAHDAEVAEITSESEDLDFDQALVDDEALVEEALAHIDAPPGEQVEQVVQDEAPALEESWAADSFSNDAGTNDADSEDDLDDDLPAEVDADSESEDEEGPDASNVPRRSGLREELMGTFSQLYGK